MGQEFGTYLIPKEYYKNIKTYEPFSKFLNTFDTISTYLVRVFVEFQGHVELAIFEHDPETITNTNKRVW
jgi:hypothetical protein